MKRHARAARHQLAHHRSLDAGVDHGDPRPVAALPVMRDFARRHDGGEILADHRRLGVDQLARLRLGELAREDAAAHRAGVADVAHERARVDAGDRSDAAVGQPVEPAALGARRVLAVARFAHDRRARPRTIGLHRGGARAVVADVRVGERDQLTGERRVGHRFLVAGHAGREDDLADGVRLRPTPLAVEARAVLEQHVSVVRAHRISLWTDLNSGVPARSSSSNSALSTVVTTAPARSRRSSERS